MTTPPPRHSSRRSKPPKGLSRRAYHIQELGFDEESSCLLLIVAMGKDTESAINALSTRLDCLGVDVFLLVTDENTVLETLSRYDFGFDLHFSGCLIDLL